MPIRLVYLFLFSCCINFTLLSNSDFIPEAFEISGSRIFVNAKINDDLYKFRLDTGSMYGFISSELVNKYKLQPVASGKIGGMQLAFELLPAKNLADIENGIIGNDFMTNRTLLFDFKNMIMHYN